MATRQLVQITRSRAEELISAMPQNLYVAFTFCGIPYKGWITKVKGPYALVNCEGPKGTCATLWSLATCLSGEIFSQDDE